MTLSIDLLRRLLKDRGTISAYEGARILMCSPEQFCSLAASDWWHVLQIPGPEGWLYTTRTSLSARAKVQGAIREYADTHAIGRSGYGRVSREVGK